MGVSRGMEVVDVNNSQGMGSDGCECFMGDGE